MTQAMGINPPSLYAAFGSKEALFKEAVGLFIATDDACTPQALSGELSARQSNTFSMNAIRLPSGDQAKSVRNPWMPRNRSLLAGSGERTFGSLLASRG